MSANNTMNIQGYLGDTYRIIKEEPVILILGGLVVQLLTILTMGILAGPFLGGYFLLIIRYLRDKRKPTFKDIFAGLQQFTVLLPYFLVLLTIFIGFMLLIVPGFILSTWWIYVLPLMVDRKISFSEAMKLSTKKVNETGFLMHLVFLLLITLIPILLLNFLSAMLPFLFVLKILLPPLQAGCLVSLYVDQFGPDDKEDDTPLETVAEEDSIAPSIEPESVTETQKKESPKEEDPKAGESAISGPSEDQGSQEETSVPDISLDEPNEKIEQSAEESRLESSDFIKQPDDQGPAGNNTSVEDSQSFSEINEEKNQD